MLYNPIFLYREKEGKGSEVGTTLVSKTIAVFCDSLYSLLDCHTRSQDLIRESTNP